MPDYLIILLLVLHESLNLLRIVHDWLTHGACLLACLLDVQQTEQRFSKVQFRVESRKEDAHRAGIGHQVLRSHALCCVVEVVVVVYA